MYILVKEAAIVQYGQTRKLEKLENNISATTYTADSMCEPPANTTGFWNPGYIYNGLLKDLKPNTRYFYSYGTKNVNILCFLMYSF